MFNVEVCCYRVVMGVFLVDLVGIGEEVVDDRYWVVGFVVMIDFLVMCMDVGEIC